MVDARAQGGDGELVLKGDRASVLQDEKTSGARCAGGSTTM